MKIVVMDGQGGGVGRLLVEKLKAGLPEGHFLVAVGANALATAAMLRAGADAGATGENAFLFNCKDAALLLGPSGIASADAMLGEISPAMAHAVLASPARKFLLPMDPCTPGAPRPHTLVAAIEAMVLAALEYARTEAQR